MMGSLRVRAGRYALWLVVVGVGLVALSWWLSWGEDTVERTTEAAASHDGPEAPRGLAARVTAFFTEDGLSARKTFLKSPLKYAHVTSGFGSRFHPVLNYVGNHNGVDYHASADLTGQANHLGHHLQLREGHHAR